MSMSISSSSNSSRSPLQNPSPLLEDPSPLPLVFWIQIVWQKYWLAWGMTVFPQTGQRLPFCLIRKWRGSNWRKRWIKLLVTWIGSPPWIFFQSCCLRPVYLTTFSWRCDWPACFWGRWVFLKCLQKAFLRSLQENTEVTQLWKAEWTSIARSRSNSQLVMILYTPTRGILKQLKVPFVGFTVYWISILIFCPVLRRPRWLTILKLLTIKDHIRQKI